MTRPVIALDAILLRRLARSKTLQDTRASGSWEFARARQSRRCGGSHLALSMSVRGRDGVREAGSTRVPGACLLRSVAPVLGRITAKAMARRRVGGFARSACGGVPIGCPARQRCCRFAVLVPAMPGAKMSTTGVTTIRFAGRPMNQATGFGAMIGSTISSSRSIITPGRALPELAARSLSTSRARICTDRRLRRARA
jgi:hypothetical protein